MAQASPNNGNWQTMTPNGLTLNDKTGAGINNNPPALFDIDNNWVDNKKFGSVLIE